MEAWFCPLIQVLMHSLAWLHAVLVAPLVVWHDSYVIGSLEEVSRSLVRWACREITVERMCNLKTN